MEEEFSAERYFESQDLIDLYDKVEPVKLSLTKFEAKLVRHYLEDVPPSQTHEPFINSIIRKCDEELSNIKEEGWV